MHLWQSLLSSALTNLTDVSIVTETFQMEINSGGVWKAPQKPIKRREISNINKLHSGACGGL